MSTDRNGARMEIIVIRDPDSPTYLRVFLDGAEVRDFGQFDVDPGAGWDRGDWDQALIDHGTGTPAFMAACRQEHAAAGNSEYIIG